MIKLNIKNSVIDNFTCCENNSTDTSSNDYSNSNNNSDYTKSNNEEDELYNELNGESLNDESLYMEELEYQGEDEYQIEDEYNERKNYNNNNNKTTTTTTTTNNSNYTSKSYYDKDYEEFKNRFKLKKPFHNSTTHITESSNSNENSDNSIQENSIDYIYSNEDGKLQKDDIYYNFPIKIKSLEIYLQKGDTYPIYIEKKDIFKSEYKKERDFQNHIIDSELKIPIESPKVNLFINSIPFNIKEYNSRNNNYKNRIRGSKFHKDEKDSDIPSPILLFYEFLIYFYIYNNLVEEIDLLNDYILPYYQIEKFKYFTYIKDHLNMYKFYSETDSNNTSMDISSTNDNDSMDYKYLPWLISIEINRENSLTMNYNYVRVNITIKSLQEF